MQFHAKSANVNLSSFPTFNEPNPSLFHRRYSIDGRAMEEHKNILGIYPKNTQRKILSFIFIHK